MPFLVKNCTLPSMIAYAGSTWDWHRVHYDMEFLKAKGMDRPIVDGQIFGAYAVQAIQDWLGDKAFISLLDFRFTQLVYAGETIRCEGEIIQSDLVGVSISLKINVIDADANILRTAVEPMSATVIWKD